MITSFQEQLFNFLAESQYFPPEQMHRQQVHQLEQLVRFARSNVPLYKERLNCLFKRDGTFDFGRWAEVPILKRRDLADRRDAMLAPALPPGHGPWKDFTGSGTTRSDRHCAPQHAERPCLGNRHVSVLGLAWV